MTKRPFSRKKIIIAAAALVAALAGILWFSLRHPGQGLPLTDKDRFTVPEHIVICLDAGHGGDDSGAVSGDRQEKDDNLTLALAVRDKLQAGGYNNLSVLLTRAEDTALTLQQRCDIANDASATLFVALHRNSGGASGAEVWIPSQGYRPARRLAQNIMDQLEAVGVNNVRGVRSGTAADPQKDYTVLARTNMPACLVELGFIDSDADNQLFDQKLADYAAAIADGILQMVELK